MQDSKGLNDVKIYRAILDNCDYGILLGNDGGIITDANEFMLKMSGYSSEELLGRKIDILFPQNALEAKPLQYDKIHMGFTIDMERRMLTKSGRKFPIRMSSRKIMYNCLRAEFRFASETDFESGRLNVSHDSIAETIANADDILLDFDAETQEMIYGNEALAKSFGVPLKQLIGDRLGNYVPEGIVKNRIEYSRKAVRENTIQVFDDGRENRRFHHILIPLNRENPNIVRAISLETTESAALKKLSSTQAMQMELLSSNLPICLFALDNFKRIESMAVYSSDFLGYTHNELENILLHWKELINPEDLAPVLKQFRACRDGEKINVEFRFKGKNEDWFWVLLNGRWKIGPAGKLSLHGIFIDITEQKTVQEHLSEAVKEKDILMKEVNHRVKNNLAMISSIISLKEMDSGQDLSDISRQIDAIRIVHEKLYQSDNIREINFSEYCNDLISTISLSFSEVPVRFTNNVNSLVLPTKRVIPLGLIVNELATNAMKHGSTDGQALEITMNAETSDSGLCILSVSNNGTPISENIDFNNPETLGLRLVQALTTQVQGDIEITRKPHPVFRITFKPEL